MQTTTSSKNLVKFEISSPIRELLFSPLAERVKPIDIMPGGPLGLPVNLWLLSQLLGQSLRLALRGLFGQFCLGVRHNLPSQCRISSKHAPVKNLMNLRRGNDR